MDARVRVYTWADQLDGMASVVCALGASLVDEDTALVALALVANMVQVGVDTSAWREKEDDRFSKSTHY